MRKLFLVLMLLIPAVPAVAMVKDDPLAARFMLDKGEGTGDVQFMAGLRAWF